MKWILTFIAGVLLGAGGLFAFLRQLPAAAPTVAIAGISAAMAPAPPVAVVTLDAASLPPAPAVRIEPTEADFAAARTPALDKVIAVQTSAAPAVKPPRSGP